MLQTKVGASLISNVNEEIVDYRSTLFKTSHSIKDSVLNMLFGWRKRWAKFVADGLTALFQAVLAAGVTPQGNSPLWDYLYTIDPPTYGQMRYLDWV